MGYDSHIYFTVFETTNPKNTIPDSVVRNIIDTYKNFKYSFTEHGYEDYMEVEYVRGSSTGQITKHKSRTKVYIDKTRILEIDISKWFPIMTKNDRCSLACGVTDCFIEGFSQFSKLFPSITFRMYVTFWDNMCLSVYDFVNGESTKLLYVSNEDCEIKIEHQTYDFLKDRTDLFDDIDRQLEKCKRRKSLYLKDDDDEGEDEDTDYDDVDYEIDMILYLTPEGEDITEFFEKKKKFQMNSNKFK